MRRIVARHRIACGTIAACLSAALAAVTTTGAGQVQWDYEYGDLSGDLLETDFERLDPDADGVITEAEAADIPVLLEKKFSHIDTNADGGIDAVEYENWRSRERRARRRGVGGE